MSLRRGRGKQKGSAFENLVANKIIEAAKFEKKDCYRTPLSGGHPYADAGDLQISEKLLPYFPFSVECKHRRDWHPGVMFAPRGEERAWILQTYKAARGEKVPLLIMRGNRTEIFVAGPFTHLFRYFDAKIFRVRPVLVLASADVAGKREQETWLMLPFQPFLDMLGERVRMGRPFKSKLSDGGSREVDLPTSL